jgi:hypothetical protein
VQPNSRYAGRRDDPVEVLVEIIRIEQPAGTRAEDEIVVFPRFGLESCRNLPHTMRAER